MKSVFAFVAVAGLACAAHGQVIPDRATLNGILGGGGTTDGFEAFDIGDGNAVLMDVLSLSNGTMVNGQGPGLVNTGATYSGTNNLQWNGDDYYELTTRTILSGGILTISYDNPTSAMGLDMAAFAGFGDTANIAVYDANQGLLYSGAMALPNDASDVFFGYQSAGGIGSVVLTGSAYPWSPNIDDHTYGVPTPASAALLGLGGLAAMRRRR